MNISIKGKMYFILGFFFVSPHEIILVVAVIIAQECCRILMVAVIFVQERCRISLKSLLQFMCSDGESRRYLQRGNTGLCFSAVIVCTYFSMIFFFTNLLLKFHPHQLVLDIVKHTYRKIITSMLSGNYYRLILFLNDIRYIILVFYAVRLRKLRYKTFCVY